MVLGYSEINLSCYANMQGDSKHLLLAHLFNKTCFVGLILVEVTRKYLLLHNFGLYSFGCKFHEVASVRQINFKRALISYN